MVDIDWASLGVYGKGSGKPRDGQPRTTEPKPYAPHKKDFKSEKEREFTRRQVKAFDEKRQRERQNLLDAHPELRTWVEVLEMERPTTKITKRRRVDWDVLGAMCDLRIDRLPYDARCLAVNELRKFLDELAEEAHGDKLPTEAIFRTDDAHDAYEMFCTVV